MNKSASQNIALELQDIDSEFKEFLNKYKIICQIDFNGSKLYTFDLQKDLEKSENKSHTFEFLADENNSIRIQFQTKFLDIEPLALNGKDLIFNSSKWHKIKINNNEDKTKTNQEFYIKLKFTNNEGGQMLQKVSYVLSAQEMDDKLRMLMQQIDKAASVIGKQQEFKAKINHLELEFNEMVDLSDYIKESNCNNIPKMDEFLAREKVLQNMIDNIYKDASDTIQAQVPLVDIKTKQPLQKSPKSSSNKKSHQGVLISPVKNETFEFDQTIKNQQYQPRTQKQVNEHQEDMVKIVRALEEMNKNVQSKDKLAQALDEISPCLTEEAVQIQKFLKKFIENVPSLDYKPREITNQIVFERTPIRENFRQKEVLKHEERMAVYQKILTEPTQKLDKIDVSPRYAYNDNKLDKDITNEQKQDLYNKYDRNLRTELNDNNLDKDITNEQKQELYNKYDRNLRNELNENKLDKDITNEQKQELYNKYDRNLKSEAKPEIKENQYLDQLPRYKRPDNFILDKSSERKPDKTKYEPRSRSPYVGKYSANPNPVISNISYAKRDPLSNYDQNVKTRSQEYGIYKVEQRQEIPVPRNIQNIQQKYQKTDDKNNKNYISFGEK